MISQPFQLPQTEIAAPLNTNPTMPNWVMFDTCNDTFAGGINFARWSPGATLITPISFQPLSGELWTIYGWSIVFQGSLRDNPLLVSAGSTRKYGTFGKIYAGMIKGNYSSQIFAGSGGLLLFPPPDISLISPIWDPNVDSMFRVDAQSFSNATPGTNFYVNYSLPQPIQADQNSQFSFGLWMTPSLMAGVELIVGQVTFNILYESQPISHTYARPSG